MKPLRLAVIGAGHLGRFHTRILAARPDVDIVGIADTNPAACEQLAATCGAAAWNNHQPAIGRVDAAVIATPTRWHHAVACDLLRAGVHLLIEKPLAASVAEAEELVALARQHGAVLQVGHIERFNPVVEQASQENIGAPKYIEACRSAAHKFRSTDIGVVLDLMIHDIDLALALTAAEVARVDALGLALFGRHEDVAQARLTFDNGCVANLSSSRASFVVRRSMQIWGDRGFAGLDLGARTANLVRPDDILLGEGFDVERLPAERIAHYRDNLFGELLHLEPVAAGDVDQLTAELSDFVESIQTGRAPRVPGEQGLAALAVAERVLEAIAAHQWDGRADGRIGPFAEPPVHVLPGPHWHRQPAAEPLPRKEAG
ncbi:MAG: Gfo/Idh/MocA family oxidoreductase [Pirellulales bacterium]|nr:Gfo/Idh/MocA family oxidoreductase [Pirellulales bacterium]